MAQTRRPHDPQVLEGGTPPRRGVREVLAVLLLFTGFPPLFGWVIGLTLLVMSPLWTFRQKLLGVLVWPGGLMVSVLGAGLLAPTSHKVCSSLTQTPVHGAISTLGSVARSCTTSGVRSPWAAVGIVVALVGHVAVAIYLYRAAGRNAVDA